MKALLQAALAASTLASSATADAAVVMLDFGGNGQDVQAGYTGVSGAGSGFLGSPVFSVPAAALPVGMTMTVSSSSSLSFRDRGSFSAANYGTEVDLLEDYIRAGTGMPAGGIYSTMTIDIAGLSPETDYSITFQLYDGAISASTQGNYGFTITGTGDSNIANNDHALPFHSGFPGLAPEFREGHTEVFTTDPFGNLQILITQTAGTESTIPLNSLEMDVVPEPAAGVLALCGAFAVCRRRRMA